MIWPLLYFDIFAVWVCCCFEIRTNMGLILVGMIFFFYFLLFWFMLFWFSNFIIWVLPFFGCVEAYMEIQIDRHRLRFDLLRYCLQAVCQNAWQKYFCDTKTIFLGLNLQYIFWFNISKKNRLVKKPNFLNCWDDNEHASYQTCLSSWAAYPIVSLLWSLD